MSPSGKPDIAIPAVLPSKTVPDGGLVIHHQGAWTSERFVGAAGRGCRLEDVVARHPPSHAALDVRTHWVTACALPYGARRALLPPSVAAGPGRSDHRRPEVATAWMTSPRPQSIERIAAKTGTARTGHGAVTARSSSRRHRRPRHYRLPGALAAPGPLRPPDREATERSQRLPIALAVELGRRLPLGHDTDAAHDPGTRRLTDGAAVVRILAGTTR
ncbi:ATP-dependent DNA ligase [Streptomyces sp. NEAU-H3]|uniref:ATP-dependent DNA ligase n=1 Tax=Streptomyces sp. NEAU-H3 TaxID=2720636 RepID=UPI001ADD5B1F|nr:ATP-dependent DNA ligase [Streptomyces sp. NEAU-H3]